MQTITIGIITAPERAAQMIESIIDELPKKFNYAIGQNLNCEVEYVVDPLTGSAESSYDILDNACKIKKQNEWDFAICITDLPVFFENKAVAADISFEYCIAQISIPTFGCPPLKKRITKTLIQLMLEMFNQVNEELDSGVKSNKQYIKRVFPIMTFKRQESSSLADNTIQKRKQHDDHIDVRYLIASRFHGLWRIILGMTFANNPMKIMSSFKNIIAIAFTTGAFALIFPTIWKWGQVFSIYRLVALMIVAIIGLVTWIIVAHNLWEHPSKKSKPKIRRLYNAATTTTLLIDVTAYYMMMFTLFLTATLVLIPPGYLETIIDKVDDESLPVFIHYARVAWIEASISIIVSAMGAGLEDDNLVREVTYGYRQNRRYQEIQQNKNG